MKTARLSELNSSTSNNGGFFFQPKLSINQPNDIYEQEADAVAEKIIQSKSIQDTETFFKPITISPIQRKCAHCEAEEKEKLQRKENNTDQTEAGPEFENYVDGINNSGDSLPSGTKSFFESRFGYDFSNVKIHTDSVAAKSAQSINALAYTSGNNIVFNQNQYQPGTTNGDKLIAHELTHVVQQKHSQIIQRSLGLNSDQLDYEFLHRVDINDWQAAAEVLNDFTEDEIRFRLQSLTNLQIISLHQGAIDNPRLGVNSVVARLTQPAPSPEVPAQAPRTVENISSLSAAAKLGRAWGYARRQLGREIVQQIQGFFSPESLTALAVFAALYLASQFSPIGWIADAAAVGVIGLSIFFVGRLALDVAENLYRFLSAINASSEQDLETAGNALARAIAEGGIGIVIAFLSRALPRGGPRPPTTETVSGIGWLTTPEGLTYPVRVQTVVDIPARIPTALQATASYMVIVPPPPAGGGGGGRPPRSEEPVPEEPRTSEPAPRSEEPSASGNQRQSTPPPAPAAVRFPNSTVPISATRGDYQYFSNVRNGIRYETSQGELLPPSEATGTRSRSAQRSVSGGTGDDAGHRIGTQYGGAGGIENLARQNRIQNQGQGTFYALESYWTSLLESGTRVIVRVADAYRAGEERAFLRIAEWFEIDAGGAPRYQRQDFANTTTPRVRELAE